MVLVREEARAMRLSRVLGPLGRCVTTIALARGLEARVYAEAYARGFIPKPKDSIDGFQAHGPAAEATAEPSEPPIPRPPLVHTPMLTEHASHSWQPGPTLVSEQPKAKMTPFLVLEAGRWVRGR